MLERLCNIWVVNGICFWKLVWLFSCNYFVISCNNSWKYMNWRVTLSKNWSVWSNLVNNIFMFLYFILLLLIVDLLKLIVGCFIAYDAVYFLLSLFFVPRIFTINKNNIVRFQRYLGVIEHFNFTTSDTYCGISWLSLQVSIIGTK